MARRILKAALAASLLFPGLAFGAAPPATPAASPAAPAAAPAAPAQAPGMPAPDPVAAAARAAAAAKALIDVTDGWARATPANATTGAVYVKVVNNSKDADKLLGAKVWNADKADLHTGPTVMPAFAVGAGATITFAPTASFVQLTGLKAPLREGDSFLISLQFEKAGNETVVVHIGGANANGPPPPARNTARDITSGVTPDPAKP